MIGDGQDGERTGRIDTDGTAQPLITAYAAGTSA